MTLWQSLEGFWKMEPPSKRNMNFLSVAVFRAVGWRTDPFLHFSWRDLNLRNHVGLLKDSCPGLYDHSKGLCNKLLYGNVPCGGNSYLKNTKQTESEFPWKWTWYNTEQSKAMDSSKKVSVLLYCRSQAIDTAFTAVLSEYFVPFHVGSRRWLFDDSVVYLFPGTRYQTMFKYHVEQEL